MITETSSLTDRIVQFLGRDNIARTSQYIVMALALCSCVATLWVMRLGSGVLRATAVLPYLYINLGLLVLMAIFIIRRVIILWLDRHLVMVLAITCLLPAVGISAFSTFFFNSSIKSLFTEPFKTTINAATEIAENYIKENQKTIRIDGMSMVMQLRPVASMLIQNTEDFNLLLTQHSEQRGLNEVLVFDGLLNIIAKSYFKTKLQ